MAGVTRQIASKFLATIVTDVPIVLDLDRANRTAYDRECVFKLFTELEFFSLIDRLPGGPEKPSFAPLPPARPAPLNVGLFADLPPAEDDAHAHADALAPLSGTTVGGAALPKLDLPVTPSPVTEADDLGDQPTPVPTEAFVIDTEEAFQALVERMRVRKDWVIDVETTGKDPMQASLVGISLACRRRHRVLHSGWASRGRATAARPRAHGPATLV